MGLYRDDNLAAFKNINGLQAKKNKKHFQNIFHENNLSIIVKCNLKIVNYLDITLNSYMVCANYFIATTARSSTCIRNQITPKYYKNNYLYLLTHDNNNNKLMGIMIIGILIIIIIITIIIILVIVIRKSLVVLMNRDNSAR